MPLIIPQNLPAFAALQNENVFVMNEARAVAQDIRPLRILVANLMPTKIATETQLARVLANSPLQVELTLLRMDTHESKNTSAEHLESFYTRFSEVRNSRFDGMIITGAPVELLEYRDVDYWDELCEIMEFSKTNVYSTLHVCWGAQAALWYHYGIPKHPLAQKMFGVFEHRVRRPLNPLMRGFDEIFYAPHSRHTEIRRADIDRVTALRVLAESDEAGPHILSTENGRQVFVLGHQEYDRETLYNEYIRDVRAGLPIEVPKNYFRDDDPEGNSVSVAVARQPSVRQLAQLLCVSGDAV